MKEVVVVKEVVVKEVAVKVARDFTRDSWKSH